MTAGLNLPSIQIDLENGIAIRDLPLLILVGVTGVGKSTTLTALKEAGFAIVMLPDRRILTDDLLIARLQADDGEPMRPVTDRVERFAYTRRYRERYDGGMAHALAGLHIDADPSALSTLNAVLCFDGLRGAEEVRYAAQHLPLARFLVLDAPDTLRVERLIKRADTFDRIQDDAKADAALLDLPGVDELFSPTDQDYLRSLVTQGRTSADDLRAKLSIVIAERQNYDPVAALAELAALAAERTLLVDTAQSTPAEVAQGVIAFWRTSIGESINPQRQG